jgi:protein SCO1/2
LSCYAHADQQSADGGDWLNERLGSTIPGNIILRDESGADVRLKDLIDKPVVLILVYYHCSHICPQMLFGLAETLSGLDLVPGRDYRAITLSFDDSDTPLDARTQKINYIKAINRPFPEDSWKFLTGDRDNIEKVSRAAGIRYEQVMHGFIHPEVLIFVSPGRKITRYLHVSTSAYGLQYPVTFSNVEFTGALMDASKGIVGSPVRTTPLLCFPREPEQQERFFHLLSVMGVITLLLLLALFIYLNVTSRKSSGGRR